jgi:membrane protease YdiL (CAAX protease family)
MSIEINPNLIAIGVMAWSLLAVVLIGWLGVGRRRDEFSIPRLEDREPGGILFYSMIVGAFVWFAVSVGYGQYLRARHGWPATQPPTGPATAPTLAAGDLLFLSTIPPLLGLVSLWLLNMLLTPRGLATLGARIRDLPRGILGGLLGIFIAMPLVFWSGAMMEAIYRRLHLHTPSAHELLETLQKNPSDRRIALVVLAAVVIAPPFEEFLFRGHLQTLLRHFFRKWLPAVFSERGAAWGAIVCASALFALVHPLWMAPMIFVLALCLGYAYERTGNLWVCIVMHGMFNLLSIGQFLMYR